MGEIHDLIVRHGKERALELVSDKRKRHLVEIAAEILADESDRLGITYSGFCLTALPHRRIEDLVWRRDAHRLTLLVQSGYDRSGQPIGVPYGPKARLILIYLQTLAVQTQSRRIALGRTMHNWMERMEVSAGGKTYTQIREQSNRISACSLSFFWDSETPEGKISARRNDPIVKDAIRFTRPPDLRQGELWQEEVELSETFYEALRAHPVPILDRALKIIQGKSLAIDIYIWLAYRLHSLGKATSISWLSLYDQFGAGFGKMYHFKPTFIDALQLALAAYPEARVEILKEEGLMLSPSPPPAQGGTRSFLSLSGAVDAKHAR